MKLLIVDDSMIIRKSVEQFTKDLGLELVGTAANGVEAIEMFSKHLPDIVTLDITMPEMDGLTALKQMMSINSKAKVIVISAISAKTAAIDALSLGAKHFLGKPFNSESLRAAFEKVMKEA